MATVILPRKNLLKMDERSITIEIPSKTKQEKDYSILERTRGLWSDKNIDPVKYQRKIRREWDRKIK